MLKSLTALFIIALFTLFAIRSHYAAMLMYWWFGIFRPHEWMWWDLSAFRLPLMAAALFLVPMVLTGKLPAIRDPISVLIVMLLGAATIAQVAAGCDQAYPADLSTVVTIVIVTLFTQKLLNSPAAIFGTLLTVSLSLDYVSSKAGILATLSGESLYDADIGGGGFTDSNSVALGTAMSVFFLIFCCQCLRRADPEGLLPTFWKVRYRRKVTFAVLVVAALGGVLFVIASESRGSALAFVCGTLVWVMLHPKRLRFALALLLGAVLLIGIVGVSEDYTDRLGSAFAEEDERDNSAASRPHFWHIARVIASNHKLGAGVGCFQTYYDRYDDSGGMFGQRRSVHSSHFAILAEVGYPGIILWCLLLLTSYRKLWKVRRVSRGKLDESDSAWFFFWLSNALIAALTVFVLGGNFYEMPFNDYIWLMFAFTIAAGRMTSTTDKRPLKSIDAQALGTTASG